MDNEQKLQKLSMEIRLFETLEENKLRIKNPNIKYTDMLTIISKKVYQKFGKEQKELLEIIIKESLN